MKKIYLLFFAFLFASFYSAYSQVVDSTFGEPYSLLGPLDSVPGITGIGFDERSDTYSSMFFLDDGKIIITGNTSENVLDSDFAFARLMPDGKFDQSAGPDGKVRLDLGHDGDYCLSGARYQSDQMILGGRVRPPGDFVYNCLLARMDFDGNLDTSFGNDGQVMIDLPGRWEMVTEILPLPDGKIIIAGDAYFGETGTYQFPDSTFIFVGRLTADGQVDSTFANDGFLYQKLNTCMSAILSDAKLDTQGRIVITGAAYHPYPGEFDGDVQCDHSIPVCRYLPDGQPDPDFGENGVAVFPVTKGKGNALYLNEDNSMMVVGVNSAPLTEPIYTFVGKMTADGIVDSTFSENGRFNEFIHGYLADGTEPVDMVVLNDELLVGTVDSPIAYHLTFGLLCLTEEGELNPEFNEDGVFDFRDDYPEIFYSIKNIHLSDDGQGLYFSGTYRVLGNDNMMVCRLDISEKNPLSISDVSNEAEGIQVFPNPAHSGVNIVLPDGLLPQNGEVIFYDGMGRKHLSQKLQNGRNTVRLDGLLPGIYFYEVKDGGRKLRSGKLVKQ